MGHSKLDRCYNVLFATAQHDLLIGWLLSEIRLESNVTNDVETFDVRMSDLQPKDTGDQSRERREATF